MPATLDALDRDVGTHQDLPHGTVRAAVRALDGLDLSLDAGTIGLVGANGAGKSTLLPDPARPHPSRRGHRPRRRHRRRRRPGRRADAARLHARARLPAHRPDRGRRRGDARRDRRAAGARRPPAGVRRARPRRPRRGPLPSDRGVLDRHAPAGQAGPGARRRPRRSSCSTNPPPASTPPAARRCSPSFAGCPRSGSRSSWRPTSSTTCRRPATRS